MKTSFQFAYTRDKKLVMQSKRTNPLKHGKEYHLVLYKECCTPQYTMLSREAALGERCSIKASALGEESLTDNMVYVASGFPALSSLHLKL